MQKMTFTSNQTAFEYAIYEIVGSYFKKATCVSTIQEQKLIVHFKEQKQDTQCLMENKVDGYVKGVLLKKLPADPKYQKWKSTGEKAPLSCSVYRPRARKHSLENIILGGY